jgi:hypothetical protein
MVGNQIVMATYYLKKTKKSHYPANQPDHSKILMSFKAKKGVSTG